MLLLKAYLAWDDVREVSCALASTMTQLQRGSADHELCVPAGRPKGSLPRFAGFGSLQESPER